MTPVQQKRISLAYDEYRLAIRKARMDYAMRLRSLARRLMKSGDPKEADALLEASEKLIGEPGDPEEDVDG